MFKMLLDGAQTEAQAEELSEPSLEELIVESRNGSEEAFHRVYLRVVERATIVLRSYGLSTADQDDCLQETMLRVFRFQRDYDPKRAAFRSWFFQIVRNVARDQYNKNKLRVARLESNERPTEEGMHLANLPDRNHDNRRIVREAEVQEILARLSDEDSSILKLKFLEGLQDSEIAQIYGLSLSATKGLIRNAKRNAKIASGQGATRNDRT